MRDSPNALMLFAAGFGTRMGSLTADRPKPLVEVAGRPLIDHALDLVMAAHVRRVVANLHYRADMLHVHLSKRDVSVSIESNDILETGGGLRRALPMLGGGPVFTMNCDAIWSGPNPIKELRAAWNPAKMDALLLLVDVADATGHGGTGDFVLDRDGRIMRGAGMIYSGVQIIRTDELHDIPQQVFSLNVLWDRMLARGRVYGLRYTGKWCDVGSPEGITQAESLLARARHV